MPGPCLLGTTSPKALASKCLLLLSHWACRWALGEVVCPELAFDWYCRFHTGKYVPCGSRRNTRGISLGTAARLGAFGTRWYMPPFRTFRALRFRQIGLAVHGLWYTLKQGLISFLVGRSRVSGWKRCPPRPTSRKHGHPGPCNRLVSCRSSQCEAGKSSALFPRKR